MISMGFTAGVFFCDKADFIKRYSRLKNQSASVASMLAEPLGFLIR